MITNSTELYNPVPVSVTLTESQSWRGIKDERSHQQNALYKQSFVLLVFRNVSWVRSLKELCMIKISAWYIKLHRFHRSSSYHDPVPMSVERENVIKVIFSHFECKLTEHLLCRLVVSEFWNDKLCVGSECLWVLKRWNECWDLMFVCFEKTNLVMGLNVSEFWKDRLSDGS